MTILQLANLIDEVTHSRDHDAQTDGRAKSLRKERPQFVGDGFGSSGHHVHVLGHSLRRGAHVDSVRSEQNDVLATDEEAAHLAKHIGERERRAGARLSEK